MEPWIIEPEPLTTVQVRLVIWETEGLRNADVEDTSDIYIIAFIDPNNKQSTDTHFRCTTGTGSFNWRIVLPLEVPRVSNKLYLHAYLIS